MNETQIMKKLGMISNEVRDLPLEGIGLDRHNYSKVYDELTKVLYIMDYVASAVGTSQYANKVRKMKLTEKQLMNLTKKQLEDALDLAVMRLDDAYKAVNAGECVRCLTARKTKRNDNCSMCLKAKFLFLAAGGKWTD